jgi:hypothetical protein
MESALTVENGTAIEPVPDTKSIPATESATATMEYTDDHYVAEGTL